MKRLDDATPGMETNGNHLGIIFRFLSSFLLVIYLYIPNPDNVPTMEIDGIDDRIDDVIMTKSDLSCSKV